MTGVDRIVFQEPFRQPDGADIQADFKMNVLMIAPDDFRASPANVNDCRRLRLFRIAQRQPAAEIGA